MNIAINRTSKEPIFQQIFHSIADRIESGLIPPDFKLPSVRQLSSSIPASLVTVSRAYQLLEKNSYTYSQQGKGTFVRSMLPQPADQKPLMKSEFLWQEQIQDYIPRAQFWTRNKAWDSESMLHLSCAYVHRSLMPMNAIAHKLLTEAIGDSTMLYDYSPIQGDKELRRSIREYFKTLNLSVSEDELIVTNGTQQGITLIADTFVGIGDVVIMEAPTFMAAIDVFRKRGARIVTVPVDKDGMVTSKLIELCETLSPKIIYTMPTYHNPTGTVLSHSRRRELLSIAQAFNCLIVEDDPWSELTYGDYPPPSIKSMDTDGHVIYLKGFSKFLLPGCRLGILHAQGQILQRLVACKGISDLGSPLPNQRLILPLLQPSYIQSYLKKLNSILSFRCLLATSILQKHMPSSVHWSLPKGGPNIWITLPAQIISDHLLQETALRKVTFLPGSSCYPSNPEYNHLRVSFSFLSEVQLEHALVTLCETVSEALFKREDSPTQVV